MEIQDNKSRYSKKLDIVDKVLTDTAGYPNARTEKGSDELQQKKCAKEFSPTWLSAAGKLSSQL